jgi:hypothetical protein
MADRHTPTAGGSAWAWGLALALAGALSACAPTRPPVVPLPPVAAPAPAPAAPSVSKPAPPLAGDWREYHRLAARQLVQANPERTYMGTVPEPLKGIPILEVELHGDGSVRNIKVQRRPRPADAQHTIQLAIEAVRRAAPFPPVSHLPKPWSYTEVFLFDEADRFKPRTLDE